MYMYCILYMYKINIDIFLFLFRLSKDKVCSNNDDNEAPSPSIMVQMLWGLSLICEAVRLKTVFKCRLFNLCTGGGADRSGRLFFQRQRPHKLHHSTLIRWSQSGLGIHSFAHLLPFTQINWATVSDSLRSLRLLMINEWMSDVSKSLRSLTTKERCERITQVAHQK